MPRHKILTGGDSGYDTHFKTTRNTNGLSDLAIPECGHYNPGLEIYTHYTRRNRAGNAVLAGKKITGSYFPFRELGRFYKRYIIL